MRLHLHFQAFNKVFNFDPRVRVLVNISLFPGLVGPPIWPHSHFQAFGKGTNFEPGARDKGCLWMCFYPLGQPSSLIIFSQTFSTQLGAGTLLFCLSQCAILFCTLSVAHGQESQKAQ